MEDQLREFVKKQLRLRGLSQADFARRGNVSVSMVSQFLKGDRGSGEKIFQATATAFDVPLAEIYRLAGVLPPENGNGKSYDAEGEYIASVIRGLTTREREEVLDFIGYLKSKRARG